MSQSTPFSFQNKSLLEHNTFRLPCVAAQLFEIYEEDQLFSIFNNQTFSYWILGGGSNVVLPDHIHIPILWIRTKGILVEEENDEWVMVNVKAGESWHDFVTWAVEANFSGIENLASIPGTVGAAPVQNIGAYGVEVSESIQKIKVFDTESCSSFWLEKPECLFSYRHSIFKTKPSWVVVEVQFILKKIFTPCLKYADLKKIEWKDPILLRNIFEQVISIRQKKLPDITKTPNVGSFFKNPILSTEFFRTLQNLPEGSIIEIPSGYKLSAARLIDACGLKGRRIGGISVSTQHALVLINDGLGTFQDVMELTSHIQYTVKKVFGVRLEPEPVFFLKSLKDA